MAYVVIIANILLAILTGCYVVLTYRLVRETKRATDQTRILFEKQFLLSTLPRLHISMGWGKEATSLTIHNSGNIAAYDVDLMVVGYYSAEDMDIPTFMVNFVPPRERNIEFTATDEGFYGVYDHLYYSIVPQERKVTAEVSLPLPPEGAYCLLEYRDLSGTNYSQVYWFYARERDGKTGFHLGDIEPHVIIPSPRIEFNFSEGRKIRGEGGGPLPNHIAHEFANHWLHSIPSGRTCIANLDVEDRGEWSDV